jgi:hypothetical protein
VPAPEPAPAPAPAGEQKNACGGFAGLQCATGFACVDDPSDDCDPTAGGADCAGVCVACDERSLHRKYVERSTDACSRIRFRCDDGEVPFSDSCGCGCVRN